jgi:hypothetical protein
MRTRFYFIGEKGIARMKKKFYRYVVIALLIVAAVSIPLNASASVFGVAGKSLSPNASNPNPGAYVAGNQSPLLAASAIHAMVVDYPNYSTSRSLVATWAKNMKTAGINMVALNAGRTEWTYFKWAGHSSSWSSDVNSSGVDFLADDSTYYGQWAQVNASIDVLSPNYIKANPSKAAKDASGQASTDLVSTAELVNGTYGQTLLTMVGYIAANYPKVASITLTGISYHVDGYGADDLALYKAATGKTDWPRNSDGTINIDDASIGTWRSAVIGQFLGKAAALAHQNGKQLFMQVGVSVNSLSTATNNYGTNYTVMLKNVDKIVVQDYFGANGYSPKYSSNIAQYLAQMGAGRSILEVGLWGASGATVSATDLKYAITSGASGGIADIMVTPESLVLSTHWSALDSLWGGAPAATSTPAPGGATSTPNKTSTPKPGATNTPMATATKTSAPVATNTPKPMPTNTPVPGSTGIRAISVEYANYATSRSEVPTWVAKLKAAGINMVAISAGRAEWTFFKWAGHTAYQSNDVTSTGIDFLAEDSATFSQFAKVSAVIDVFSPNYILANPSKGVINALGQPDPNLISTAELVNGAYGQRLLDMIAYISANYPHVDSIDITELSYRVDGYGASDLALFKADTGKSDWPRNSDGSINIDDPAIGNWRSAVIGQWLGRATALAHQYGKQVYMDVSVSWNNLGLMTNNMGTNYNVMLQNVDKIVAWDYYSLEGIAPSVSQSVGQYLATFGTNRTILSIGLWGPNSSTTSPADLQAGALASQAGGMPNVWICPGSMMTAAHWQVLNTLWGPK